MGQALKKLIKKLETSPRGLCSGITTSLLPMGVPRICSHQQVDDDRKRKYHTEEHTTMKVG